MLKGKTVLIFGGSSGIGLSAAKTMSEAGAKVILVSRNEEKLASAQKSIGCNAQSYSLDVTSDQAVEEFFEKVPPFDHVVVTASSTLFGPFLELDLGTARRLFDVKFWGSYRIARFATPKIHPGGSFVFISGIAGTQPYPDLSCAGAINAAIESLVRSLSVELAPLRFNAISPGIIDTPAWEKMDEGERKEIFHSFARLLPAHRVGQPEDIAQGVLFLLNNSFVTGTTLTIDGGHLQT